MRDLDPTRIRLLNGWVLVKKVQPTTQTRSGLVLPRAAERNNVSESMGEVVGMSERPQILNEVEIYPRDAVSIGDRIVHRGFLRHAIALGEMFGGTGHDDYYLIKPSDILGTVAAGSGIRVGEYSEYEA